MMHNQIQVAAVEVLELKDDDVGEYLRELLARKRLSSLVQSLNKDVLDGSAEVAEVARRALHRLGFVDERT